MNVRRFLMLVAPVAIVALSGCAKPKDGECKKSEDCADQVGYGKVCVEGRCEECGQDTDCKPGFLCKGFKCEPRPECEVAADCGPGKLCESGKCVVAPPPPPVSRAECAGDADCGSGRMCEAGKCVSATPKDCPAGGGKLSPVYFGFNEAVLTLEAQAQLGKDAACIKDRGFTKIVVEGNCDERGTSEYNLHLGQRRAEAVRKYLTNLGVPAKAMKTVSFGKERPVCMEQTEECWALCRRGDVVVK
jgi:peptidoglycan-associated lipoprotein